MTLLENTLASVRPADRAAMEASRQKWNEVGKPLGSLGLLEDCVIRMAGVFGSRDFAIEQKCVVVMCADNGVVSEGVSQTGQEVTAVVAKNLALGRSSVCRMARIAGASVYPVDIGMATEVSIPGLDQSCVRRGTENIRRQPAMTREQAVRAIEVGIRVVQTLAEQGVQLVATGEMGIGNTTTSSAVLSVMLNLPPELVTGRGAGLSSAGLERKLQVIREAIRLHGPNPAQPLDVLCKVGGLDIAGLVGVILGAAACRVPVLLDGLISLAAALLAVELCPDAKDCLFATHCTAEPAGRLALEALGLTPIVFAQMRLGEGTGAVTLMPMLDMAMAVYHGDTFGDIAIKAYRPLE